MSQAVETSFYGTAVMRWERRIEWPLAVAAAVFLAAYAWPILQTDLPAALVAACGVVGAVVWGLFGIDYVVRVVLAKHRGNYVAHNLVDLAVVALPVLRPLPLLRLLMLIKVLNRKASTSFRGRVGVYVTGIAAVLLLCASLAILDAERGHLGATIGSFGDAVWWSFVTVTTVGYGDVSPVTAAGRAIGIGLMLGGIALLGMVTATFAS